MTTTGKIADHNKQVVAVFEKYGPDIDITYFDGAGNIQNVLLLSSTTMEDLSSIYGQHGWIVVIDGSIEDQMLGTLEDPNFYEFQMLLDVANDAEERIKAFEGFAAAMKAAPQFVSQKDISEQLERLTTYNTRLQNLELDYRQLLGEPRKPRSFWQKLMDLFQD